MNYVPSGQEDQGDTGGRGSQSDSDSISVVKIRVQQWLTGVWAEMRRKSPVAVQQWVDSLPCPSNERTVSSSDILEERDMIENENRNENTLTEDIIVNHPASEPSNIEDRISEDAADVNPIRIPRRGPMVREASLPSDSPRHRRLLLRDSSFQSDDAASHCSSVESLLESRRIDPEAVLLSLGFGPSASQDDVCRIPQRFLKPSQVRGVDTEQFLRQQQRNMEIHESGVWGYRGLTGPPHSPPSMIVAKIMERLRNNNEQSLYLSEFPPHSSGPET